MNPSNDNPSIPEIIREELKKASDEKNRISGQRFFKEEVRMYGVKTAVVEKLADSHFKMLSDPSKSEVFGYCELLWKSGMIEETFIACNWAYRFRKQFEPADFDTFERWVSQYVNNWASCDTICNHTIGEFVVRYPEFLSRLKVWTKSENRWMRRAAAVTLIIPARQGKFLDDIFAIAEILLHDKDDMVQKGYGWMLKAASQAHQDKVFRFVLRHRADMPRTALRYAIEKMPADLKKEAMKK